MNSTTDWTEVGYYYEPIHYFGGRVYKCRGIACARNIDWMMAIPGMVKLDAYRGDRVIRHGLAFAPFHDAASDWTPTNA